MPLTNSVYRPLLRRFFPVGSRQDRFDRPSFFPVPHWWLNLDTHVRFIIVNEGNEIVDYVNLAFTEDPLDITDTLMQGGAGGSSQISSDLCPSKATNTAAISAKAVMSLDTSAGSRSGSGRTRGMSPAASRSRWGSATTAVQSTGPRTPRRSPKLRSGASM